MGTLGCIPQPLDQRPGLAAVAAAKQRRRRDATPQLAVALARLHCPDALHCGGGARRKRRPFSLLPFARQIVGMEQVRAELAVRDGCEIVARSPIAYREL